VAQPHSQESERPPEGRLRELVVDRRPRLSKMQCSFVRSFVHTGFSVEDSLSVSGGGFTRRRVVIGGKEGSSEMCCMCLFVT